jgi:hypothetical protein
MFIRGPKFDCPMTLIFLKILLFDVFLKEKHTCMSLLMNVFDCKITVLFHGKLNSPCFLIGTTTESVVPTSKQCTS